jgi:hypothetical protein
MKRIHSSTADGPELVAVTAAIVAALLHWAGVVELSADELGGALGVAVFYVLMLFARLLGQFTSSPSSPSSEGGFILFRVLLGPMLLGVIGVVVVAACSGADRAAWRDAGISLAVCLAEGAGGCIPADDAEAWGACLGVRALQCAPRVAAASNPPSGPPPSVDADCVASSAPSCYGLAGCVEHVAALCSRGVR